MPKLDKIREALMQRLHQQDVHILIDRQGIVTVVWQQAPPMGIIGATIQIGQTLGKLGLDIDENHIAYGESGRPNGPATLVFRYIMPAETEVK